jgi:hypothetical protein
VGNRLEHSETFVITPRNVANVVRGLPVPEKFVCERHGEVTTEVAIDPFDYEVYGKKVVVSACRQCSRTARWTSKSRKGATRDGRAL